MSEIKGQLLGVLLVVSIFGAIGFTLYTAFQGAATKVSQSFEKFDPTKNPAGVDVISTNSGSELGSLTF